MGTCCQTSSGSNSASGANLATTSATPVTSTHVATQSDSGRARVAEQIVDIPSGMYGIGEGTSGLFGRGHRAHINRLTQLLTNTPLLVSEIFCGYQHILCIATNGHSAYDNERLNLNISDNIYVAGDNNMGQCGLGINVYTGHNDPSANLIVKFCKIKYFQQNKIIIKRICTNAVSNCTFFITNNNQVYGCGQNNYGNLGIGDTKNRNLPVLIDYFSHLQTNMNIVDIQSSAYYSVALTGSENDAKRIASIVNYWLNIDIDSDNSYSYSYSENKIDIPKDLINIIYKYCRFGNNQVHVTRSTQKKISSVANGLSFKEQKNSKLDCTWTQNDFFDDKNIIALTIGDGFSFWVESSGKVWTCGYNHYGSLGLGYDAETYTRNGAEAKNANVYYEPVLIDYFVKNDIKIVNINSGAGHTLAIDSNNNVYSWGYNDFGQCGHGKPGTYVNIKTPTLIVSLKKFNIVNIACGEYHSYCCSKDGKHWMFGSNEHSECTIQRLMPSQNNESASLKIISSPFCIDDKNRVKCVALGKHCTMIVL